MPIACGSMPSPIHPCTRSAKRGQFPPRATRAAMHLGTATRARASGRPVSESASSSRPVTGALPSVGDGEGQDLLRGAVVHRQPSAATRARLMPTFASDTWLVVDALVCVCDDEHVVGAGRGRRARSRRHCAGCRVLSLIDDHVSVERLAGVVEEPGGLVGELQETWTGPSALSSDSTCWASCQTWRALRLAERACPARRGSMSGSPVRYAGLGRGSPAPTRG